MGQKLIRAYKLTTADALTGRDTRGKDVGVFGRAEIFAGELEQIITRIVALIVFLQHLRDGSI